MSLVLFLFPEIVLLVCLIQNRKFPDISNPVESNNKENEIAF